MTVKRMSDDVPLAGNATHFDDQVFENPFAAVDGLLFRSEGGAGEPTSKAEEDLGAFLPVDFVQMDDIVDK